MVGLNEAVSGVRNGRGAAVLATAAAGARRAPLLRALDALEHAFSFHARSGRVQHANVAFVRAVEHPVAGASLRQEVERFSLEVWGLENARRAAAVAIRLDTRRLRLAGGEYRLQATLVSDDLFGEGASVLVSTRLPDPDAFDPRVLRERFGLTSKQSRVARLLVEGLKNDEIARRLFISPHTARHHTEQVKLKVGGATRAAVGARILRLES